LQLNLLPSPKKLGFIKSEWNAHTFCISFKLETDIDILEKKALSAIENYKVDMVVANELHSNKYKVILYSPNKQP